MSKTYSVAILNKNGNWFTNFGQFFNLGDIDWELVENFRGNNIAYGYYYGEHSCDLTSDKCRTIKKVLKIPNYTVESAMKILKNGGRIFYNGLDNQIKSLKIKHENVGYTFQFGNGFDNKIVSKRWYTNGDTDLKNFLSDNLGME
jgi:hypothetical protein